MLKKILGHRLAQNYKSLLVLQLANYVTPLLVVTFLTRVLGVEMYGLVAFSIGVTQMSWIVLDFGFSVSATERISVFRGRNKYVARYIGAIFFIKAILFVIVAAAIVAYAFISAKYSEHFWLLVLSLLPILGQGFQPVWFFSGIEKMKFITFYMITAKLLFLLLVYCMVSNEGDYILVPVANGIAQIIAMFIGIYSIYRLGYFIAIPRWRDVRYTFKSTLGFFVSRVSSSFYGYGGVLFLGLFSTPTAVAVYSLANQLYNVMQSLFMPVNQAAYPYMAKEKQVVLYSKIVFAAFLLVVVAACAGYFIAPFAIPFIFGDGWDVAIHLFNWFLIAAVINVLSVMSGYPLAVAFAKVRDVNISVNVASIFYALMVAAAYIQGIISPITMVVIFVATQSYLLVHRAVCLWPVAYRCMKNEKMGLKCDAENL